MILLQQCAHLKANPISVKQVVAQDLGTSLHQFLSSSPISLQHLKRATSLYLRIILNQRWLVLLDNVESFLTPPPPPPSVFKNNIEPKMTGSKKKKKKKKKVSKLRLILWLTQKNTVTSIVTKSPSGRRTEGRFGSSLNLFGYSDREMNLYFLTKESLMVEENEYLLWIQRPYPGVDGGDKRWSNLS